jgi:hypothetical protein
MSGWLQDLRSPAIDDAPNDHVLSEPPPGGRKIETLEQILPQR